MAKNLVIVESPAKWKTIEKFLWPDYKVVASMWHIRDLPVKTLWIDIDNGFKPDYAISDEKKQTVTNLQKLAKTSKEVWIATDEDREWEAIWRHLCAALKLDPVNTKRIVFHEITKKAITWAVENPRTIDMWLVDAQQARRLLDRLVWYKVSPVLWKKIRKWLSAGRVQSVAVKLIVEKEREITAFKPVESWKVSITLSHWTKKFKTTLSKINWKVKKFSSREDVEKVLSTLFDDITKLKEATNKKWNLVLSWIDSLDFKLTDSIKKDSKRSPWAPFTTSTLQQEASRKFWFWVKQTMMVAQKLYEWMDLWNGERQGLITYMRTDSVNLSDQAKSEAKNMITSEFGADYHKSRSHKTKSSWAQEAHEAIRPTDLTRKPESLANVLEPQQLKLYTLIWKRTLASQMSEAIVEVTTFTFSPEKANNQDWITKWEVIKFEGFMKLYIEWTDDESDDDDNENSTLPNIELWETLIWNTLEATQWFSRPPARFTEASLVKKLESEWIGRPSTYAPTIWTIIDRWYIEKFDKRYLKPTEIAFTVTDFLEKYFNKMMEYKFTKDVEGDFDKVAEWKMDYSWMLKWFWDNTLKKDLENAGENAEKVIELVWKECPDCWKDLIYRHGKAGKFVWCSGFPDCKFIDQPEEEKSALTALKAKYEWKPCPDWIEWTVVVKTGRYWPFLASSEYPKVKWIWKIKDEKEEMLEEILTRRWLLIDEDSWEEMVIKNSRRWPFLAAKNYPKVKIAKNIPKEVWNEVNAKIAEKENSEGWED
mgnify:CR=1 FL=1